MRFLLPLCLCIAIVLVSSSSSHAGPHKKKHHPRKSAKQLRRELHGVRAKIHAQRVRIHEVKRTEHRITDEIHTVESRLLRTEGSLKHARARLRYLKAQQNLLPERIVATQHRLDARKRLLAMRVRQNYERGNTTYMQVLLRSRSVHDYMSRSYYVERIVDSDVRLVDGIKTDRQQLADDKRTLDAQAVEQGQVKARLEVDKEQYRTDVDRKRDLLQEVQERRENMEEALDEMEQSSHQIEAEIRAAQQTPRGRRRMLHAWTGSFIRPADGPITSGFGSRYHPILHRVRMHTGIDIGAGYGAEIRAAAGGEVIFAAYRRGYGNCVVIDHGGSVSTLYGHCSMLLVSEGQSVHQGQVIARVGSTGLATGPHLHFEVRHNGTPVNPE